MGKRLNKILYSKFKHAVSFMVKGAAFLFFAVCFALRCP